MGRSTDFDKLKKEKNLNHNISDFKIEEHEDENNPEASPKIEIEGKGDESGKSQKKKLERMLTEPCDEVGTEPFHAGNGEESKK